MDIIFGDEIMSDHEEETPAVSSLQNVAGTPSVSVPQSTAAAGISTVSASQSSTAAPATQAVPHSTSGPKDIRMQAFIADSDPDETGRDGKNGKMNFSLVSGIFVYQILRIASMLFTFTEVNKYES